MQITSYLPIQTASIPNLFCYEHQELLRKLNRKNLLLLRVSLNFCHVIEEDVLKSVALVLLCFPTQAGNASTKGLYANPTVMKIKENIDLISKLLINFTAE